MIAFLLFASLLQAPVEVSAKQVVEAWADFPAEHSQEHWTGIAGFVASAEVWRDRQIADLEASLKELRKRIPASGPARKARLEEIKQAEFDRELLKLKVTFPRPFILEGPYVSGQAGEFYNTLTVQQIVDGSIRVKNGKDEILLTGYSTKDLADGEKFYPKGVFECIGTKSFKTVAGATRTIYAFRPFQHQRALDEWVGLRKAAYAEWGGPARK